MDGVVYAMSDEEHPVVDQLTYLNDRTKAKLASDDVG